MTCSGPMRHATAPRLSSILHLEADQLEFTRGVSANFYDDSLSMLRDTGRPWVPASLVREVFAVARFAPTEHEFTVTTAACRLARGEVTMRELIDDGSLEVRDRIHTLAVYSLALLLVPFSLKRVQQMLDRAADMTEAVGGHPRPCCVG